MGVRACVRDPSQQPDEETAAPREMTVNSKEWRLGADVAVRKTRWFILRISAQEGGREDAMMKSDCQAEDSLQ